MLIYRRTSLMESTAQTLVNTVNCVGVMGKGIALEFKKREPAMFEAYSRICADKKLKPGTLWLWKESPQWVLNFPTKLHWKNPSRLEWIESGLQKFVDRHTDLGIREISFPRLGCGNGGLDWDDVRPLMERYLSELKIRVYIHDYHKDVGIPEHLEDVARNVEQSVHPLASFEGFLEGIESVIKVSGGSLEDLTSGEPFAAKTTDEGVTLEMAGTSWSMDRDDLWGVWVNLRRGFVTKEQAGWTIADDGGRALISLMSLLPHVRPIEIQKLNARDPEVALEVVPPQKGHKPAIAKQSRQTALSWH